MDISIVPGIGMETGSTHCKYQWQKDVHVSVFLNAEACGFSEQSQGELAKACSTSRQGLLLINELICSD